MSIFIDYLNWMNFNFLAVLVPTFELGINDTVLLTETNDGNTTRFYFLIIQFKDSFEIFTTGHFLFYFWLVVQK